MKLSLAATIVRIGLIATATVICLEPQTASLGQNLEDIAEREIVRRQEDLVVADRLIIAGDRALAEKDYETAYLNYLDALDKIPAGNASGDLRSSTRTKFIKTALRYAEQLIENGRYSDAEKVAKTILLPDYDPSNKAAIQLLSNLEQPDYYNKTVTPDFAEDREEVTKLLHEADEFYQAGRFDLAIKRYEQVLNIDRYNIAARKGMEQVNLAKAKYYGAAYNETRSRLLWLVDKSWERPVHRFQRGRTTIVGDSGAWRNSRDRSHHGQAQPNHHPANRLAGHHRARSGRISQATQPGTRYVDGRSSGKEGSQYRSQAKPKPARFDRSSRRGSNLRSEGLPIRG